MFGIDMSMMVPMRLEPVAERNILLTGTTTLQSDRVTDVRDDR